MMLLPVAAICNASWLVEDTADNSAEEAAYEAIALQSWVRCPPAEIGLCNELHAGNVLVVRARSSGSKKFGLQPKDK